ncbi:MAG: hypothetical protein EU549_04360 [Promethearchaeota archaeon]|nr:MAG: hypothetical protein EU549_04360 [Candidatus Lokiarchaeota archaeon]
MKIKRIKLIIIIAIVAASIVSASLIMIFVFNAMNSLPTNKLSEINKSDNIIIESDPPPEEDNQEPETPNITATLENIDSFVAEDLNSYVGDDIVSDFGVVSHVRITLDWIYVIDDHDPMAAGEIYLQKYAMIYSLGGNLYCKHKIERIDIATMNSGENYTNDIVIFDGWVWDSMIIFEILDGDYPETDDHLGYFWWLHDNTNWSATGYLIKTDTSQGDAIISVYQEKLGERQTTASDVVNLMQPYLFTDVETGYGINFEEVYGRVIKGYDLLLGKETYCIQYYFYWSEEWSILEFVHYWDYEPLLIFIDPETSDRPYRVVFDNGYYDSGDPAGDEQWWKCHEYTIYENLTMTGMSEGVFIKDVNFTADIAPLIGDSNEIFYYVKSIDDIFDSSIHNWVHGVGGFDVPVITIETCYHSFDKGDANGGTLFDFDYYVGNLTDSLIYTWFQRLETSFLGGTHSVGGQATPWYSPFCYDIMNPFNRPYIGNNFDKLLSDIIAFNDAKDSEFFSFELIKDIKTRLEIPIDANIKTNTVIEPGETFNPNITVNLDLSNAKLEIDYSLGFIIAVDWWFWEETFDFIKNGTIYVDFSNPVIQLVQTYIDTSGAFQVTFNPVGFIQIDLELTPKLLGDIINATIRFKLMELLYMYQPTLRPFLEWFINDIDFVINPVLEGFLNMDSWTSESDRTHHTFNNLEFSFSPTIIAPSDQTDFSIYIGNFSYGLRFYTDWSIEIDFAPILEIFFDDIIIELMTFPDISATIYSFGQDITLSTYTWNNYHKKYVVT